MARDTLIGVLIGTIAVLLVTLVFLARVVGEPEVDTPPAAQTAAVPLSTSEPTAVAARPVVARPTSTPARTTTPTPTPSCSIATSSQTVISSTVKVVTESGSGTAFYLGNSEFITAAHVVEGYQSVQLESPGLSLVAQVVGLSPSADVAILHATTSLKPLQWGDSSSLSAGQPIGVAGYPKGFATSAALTAGVVSRIGLNDSGQTVIQTDAALNPGNSGGPAFDECGRVIGMVTSGYVDTEGIAFALAADSVRSAMLYAREHPLIECSTRQLNIEVGGRVEWGFEALPLGYRVSGEFMVEPGGVGDLDIQFYLLGEPGPDIYRASSGEFEFSGAPAGALKIAFDNGYSLFTSKNISIRWCQYGVRR